MHPRCSLAGAGGSPAPDYAIVPRPRASGLSAVPARIPTDPLPQAPRTRLIVWLRAPPSFGTPPVDRVRRCSGILLSNQSHEPHASQHVGARRARRATCRRSPRHHARRRRLGVGHAARPGRPSRSGGTRPPAASASRARVSSSSKTSSSGGPSSTVTTQSWHARPRTRQVSQSIRVVMARRARDHRQRLSVRPESLAVNGSPVRRVTISSRVAVDLGQHRQDLRHDDTQVLRLVQSGDDYPEHDALLRSGRARVWQRSLPWRGGIGQSVCHRVAARPRARRCARTSGR